MIGFVALDVCGHTPKVMGVTGTKKAAEEIIYNAAKRRLMEAEEKAFAPENLKSLEEVYVSKPSFLGGQYVYNSSRNVMAQHSVMRYESGEFQMVEFGYNSYGEWEETERGRWIVLNLADLPEM